MRLSARRVGWRWTRVRAAPRNAAIDRSWRIPDATASATAIPKTQPISPKLGGEEESKAETSAALCNAGDSSTASRRCTPGLQSE